MVVVGEDDGGDCGFDSVKRYLNGFDERGCKVWYVFGGIYG